MKMKRNLYKRLPVAVVILLLAAMTVGVWQQVTASNGPYSFGTRVLAMPQGPVTELWFRIDPVAEVAQGGQICSATITADCVKYVEFWSYDALGTKTNVTRIRWDNWQQVQPPAPDPCSGGCLEAVAPPPAVQGRYKRDILVYATAIAVEADGTTEVEAVPLGSSFGKRPRQGAAFGVR